MGVRKLNPVTAGTRHAVVHDYEGITTRVPEPGLTSGRVKSGGRNNQGKITVRHRGGEQKRLYRRIDFRRDKAGIPARVATVEYDPNRSARIGLLNYADGEKRYMLLPNGLNVGDVSADGRFSVQKVECLGSCGTAPASAACRCATTSA